MLADIAFFNSPRARPSYASILGNSAIKATPLPPSPAARKPPKRRSVRTLSLSNEGNGKVIIFTLGGKGSGMLGVMYTINRFPRSKNGVTLACNECSHTVRVNEFDHRIGSPRTQAARAMLKHVSNEHDKKSTGKPKSQIMERWY